MCDDLLMVVISALEELMKKGLDHQDPQEREEDARYEKEFNEELEKEEEEELASQQSKSEAEKFFAPRLIEEPNGDLNRSGSEIESNKVQGSSKEDTDTAVDSEEPKSKEENANANSSKAEEIETIVLKY